MIFKKKENVCIIPARGGSKRIPFKNIKKFHGSPIISRCIKKAIKSKVFDKVIVSTDSKRIADISIKNGADVHIRSKKLSDDYTDTVTVIKNVILYLEKKNFFYKKICCIYPTSIFYNLSDLKKAIKKLNKNKDYVFSATRYEHPIHRSFYKVGAKIKMNFPKAEKKRTQDLPINYHDAAQFYLGWKNSWVKKKKFFTNKSMFIDLPRSRAQDIDNLTDWKNAEVLWKVGKRLK
jgi:pseudaminic acid cytidylyltransferase